MACGVRGVTYKVLECKVLHESLECGGVRSVERKVQSVVWSVACKVGSVKSRVWGEGCQG